MRPGLGREDLVQTRPTDLLRAAPTSKWRNPHNMTSTSTGSRQMNEHMCNVVQQTHVFSVILGWKISVNMVTIYFV